MKKIIFCFAILLSLSIQMNAQGDWSLKSPGPTVGQHAMAYAGDDHVVLFGGNTLTSSLSDETWVFDLSDNAWILRNPSVKPPGRRNHIMAYIGDDKSILFGGYGGSGTWVYDYSDNTWTDKNPASGPGGGPYLGMAWIGNDKVILWNGATWLYDLSDNTWTLKNPANQPVLFAFNSLASIGGDKVLLFGSDPSLNAVTYSYDLSDNSWTMHNSDPPPRVYQQVASLGGDQVLLFGGFDFGFSTYNDTWTFDRSAQAWALQSPATVPDGRGAYAVAPIGPKMVLMTGGYRDAFSETLSETWLYTSTAASCNLTVSAGADVNSYFGYPAGQCVTKTATVADGDAPYSYTWTLNRSLLPGETISGANSASVNVCLADTAELCVNVTDANVCTASDCAMIFAEDVRCFSGNNQKVKICHSGNSICVDASAVPAHVAHGDHVGPCTNSFISQADDEIKKTVNPVLNILPKQDNDIFSIFPNPSRGEFTITTNLSDAGNADRTIRIMNMNGQLVKEIEMNAKNRLTISIDQPGNYFIQLITNKQVITKKLVVVR